MKEEGEKTNIQHSTFNIQVSEDSDIQLAVGI